MSAKRSTGWEIVGRQVDETVNPPHSQFLSRDSDALCRNRVFGLKMSARMEPNASCSIDPRMIASSACRL